MRVLWSILLGLLIDLIYHLRTVVPCNLLYKSRQQLWSVQLSLEQVAKTLEPRVPTRFNWEFPQNSHTLPEDSVRVSLYHMLSLGLTCPKKKKKNLVNSRLASTIVIWRRLTQFVWFHNASELLRLHVPCAFRGYGSLKFRTSWTYNWKYCFADEAGLSGRANIIILVEEFPKLISQLIQFSFGA